MRNQGRDSSLDWYQHAELGYSYRISEMNCALGSEQLKRIEATIRRRQTIAEMYESKLRDFPDVIAPNTQSDCGRISWFCYVIQFTEGVDRTGRDWIADSLLNKGNRDRTLFRPASSPAFAQRFRGELRFASYGFCCGSRARVAIFQSNDRAGRAGCLRCIAGIAGRSSAPHYVEEISLMGKATGFAIVVVDDDPLFY